MKNSILDAYKQAVLTSTLLDSYQRDAYLTAAEDLPEEYLSGVTAILTGFAGREVKRNEEFFRSTAAVFARFRKTVENDSAMGQAAKSAVLAKARMLEDAVTGTGP